MGIIAQNTFWFIRQSVCNAQATENVVQRQNKIWLKSRVKVIRDVHHTRHLMLGKQLEVECTWQAEFLFVEEPRQVVTWSTPALREATLIGLNFSAEETSISVPAAPQFLFPSKGSKRTSINQIPSRHDLCINEENSGRKWVSRCGPAGRGFASMQKNLGPIRFGSPFSSKIVV